MTARIRRHSLGIHRGLFSTSAVRRGAIVLAGAVAASVMAAAPATAGDDSRSGKTSPQTKVPSRNRACNCDTPDADSKVSAQQTSVRGGRDGSKSIVSGHDEARSSITRIIARDNPDGSRTVSNQHGTSTFWSTWKEIQAKTKPPALKAPLPPEVSPPPSDAPASSGDTWTIVVGGMGDTNGSIFHGGVDQVVGYSAQLNGASARQGVDELNRLIREHRAAHPGQHIKVVGYSEGAAVVHTWVSENSGSIDNVNAVLISDPKRQGGPGGDGLSGQPYAGIVGQPLSGADRNFGDIPTVSVCTDDFICDGHAPSGPLGYPGKHGNYSFNVDDYSDTGDGQVIDGKYVPWK